MLRFGMSPDSAHGGGLEGNQPREWAGAMTSIGKVQTGQRNAVDASVLVWL